MANQAMKDVIPLLVSQYDVKSARANVASNVLKAANGDRGKVPDAIAQYNSLYNPGLVSEGLAMANASKQGVAALKAFND